MTRMIGAMKGKVRYVFFIAAFTAGGIILCQLYWIYFNYKTARNNFIQGATISLRKSVDSCLLGANTLPASLQEKSPSLTFMMTQRTNLEASGRRDPSKPRDTSYTVKLMTVKVNEDQLPGVKSLVAKLFSLNAKKEINLDTLGRFFQEDLLRNGISDSFNLSIVKTEKEVATGRIGAAIHFNTEPAVIYAELQDKNAFLLRTNLAPALISTLLILLSAGSLIYMGRIIKRQMQLDTMKTDFVNNVVHELRTPLTILRSSNEALAGFGAAHDEASLMRYLGINTLVIDDLDKNIERILDFSRSDQGKRLPVLERIDLLNVLRQAEIRFSQIDNTNIKIISDADPFEVNTDKFMIGVILSNLIDNAIKYSKEEAVIEIKTTKYDTHWKLQVSDNGVGITPTFLPYIFDKFYRVPTGDLHEVKGYGIGLAYVKRLVSDLNGKIEVMSTPGEGTNFTLTFNL